VSTVALAATTARRQPAQTVVVSAGVATLAAGALLLGLDDWRRAALLLIGALLGIALYHGAYGFTAAYRRALAERDVADVLAQLVMLALAMLLFAPLLASGRGGAVAPAGLQVAFGSFLFGLGMQLAGGCGSGTLYTTGGGSVRMALTLAAFCAGGFAGSLDLARYAALPSLGPVSLAATLGYPAAILAQLGLLTLLWLLLRHWAGNAPQRPLWQPLDRQRLLQGPWPLLLCATLLALLNALTLLIAGHPWSVTWGFTLWGAKTAATLGWDPATSLFWRAGFPHAAIGRSLLADNVSLMNFGIILGAFTAAGLAGRFAPTWRLPPRSLLAALIGGVVMGYGARLAYGCNIGAFFSGIASFSLHGWLWIACALVGSWLGLRLRPLFGF
jgi:uncharacterized membrane protein YedE/YeeE